MFAGPRFLQRTFGPLPANSTSYFQRLLQDHSTSIVWQQPRSVVLYDAQTRSMLQTAQVSPGALQIKQSPGVCWLLPRSQAVCAHVGFWYFTFVHAKWNHVSEYDLPVLCLPSALGRNSVRHPDIKSNSDGSVTLWFGPSVPADKETNWIQTTRGLWW